MLARNRLRSPWMTALVALVMTAGVVAPCSQSQEAVADDTAVSKPIEKGLRVYSAGHSFHVFVPGNLIDMAKGAGIKDHVFLGLSSIGGSRVIQHWDVVDDKFKAKEQLKSGKVDVLTLSPIHLPDDGIE